MSDSIAIKVEEVTHAFASAPVLESICLSVAKGAVHCLLGPSGSGKTTLLRLIAGLEKTQAGQIELGGRIASSPREHVPPHERRLGVVFQDRVLFPHRSVLQNLLFGVSRQQSQKLQDQARQLLHAVGMADKAERLPNSLSGGEQQRVAVARALLGTPDYVLLDEPFTGLDPGLRDDIRRVTLDLIRQNGATAVWVTHDIQEALMLGDKISVINSGSLLQTGTPDELYHSPATPTVARALGEMNLVGGTVIGGQLKTVFGEFPLPTGNGGETWNALVRPENLRLDGNSKHSVEALVEDIRFGGPQLRVQLRMAETEVLVYVDHTTSIHRGDTVQVSVRDSQRVVVLPTR